MPRNEDMGEIVPFVFNHDEEHTPIRVLSIGDKPWFVGADVCRALGLDDNRVAIRKLRSDEKGGYPIPTPGGPQQMVIIDERGLTRLVMRSDRPQAEAFKDWIVREVVPSIRHTGKYELPVAEKKLCQPELLAAVNAIHGEVASMNVRISGIEVQLGNRRGNFSQQAERYALEGVAKYNNCECPYCDDVVIVTTHGRPLPNACIHHGNGNRRDVRPTNCMPSCDDCHERIHNPNRPDHIPSHEAYSVAVSFHRKLRQKAAQIRPSSKSIKPWDFRGFTQADMGFPKIGKKHSA